MNISANAYYDSFFGKLGFPSKSCNFVLLTKDILYIINGFKNEDGLNCCLNCTLNNLILGIFISNFYTITRHINKFTKYDIFQAPTCV